MSGGVRGTEDGTGRDGGAGAERKTRTPHIDVWNCATYDKKLFSGHFAAWTGCGAILWKYADP